ncbi:epoxide hydrolase [Sphingomonas sp. LR59]|uniref:epoxide hydrolase N-terminal domain-containing protein n=1 Tax=Sphingomonas sp. LR59 TaxID=3050232 RepID=UPI002FE332EE
MPPVSFTIDVPDAALEDLQNRLSATRWPGSIDDESWDDGASLAFMRRLADHWQNRFDWRLQERRLNRMPQFMATIDDQDVHFVHRRGIGPSPIPIVITHGWPGSFVEMEQLIPLLADPGAHGGDPADAFHVVVPSLPGYGFSPAPTEGAQARGKSLCYGASSWPSSAITGSPRGAATSAQGYPSGWHGCFRTSSAASI